MIIGYIKKHSSTNRGKRMSNTPKTKVQSGFTIIEVMIVLAIAGLILAVVLVAIPQLQKNQRNESRKSVLARISAEVNNYIGNNEGQVPTNGNDSATGFTTGFYSRYIEDAPAGTFDKPGGGEYDFLDYGEGDIGLDQIQYAEASVCQGEVPTSDGANNRNFAIVVGLEGGASYCVDNQ